MDYLNLKGVNLDRPLFVKHRSRYYTCHDVRVFMIKRDGVIEIEYLVNDKRYNKLYTKSDDLMFESDTVRYYIYADVLNKRTGNVTRRLFRIDGDRVYLYGWRPEGVIAEIEYELPDGEYELKRGTGYDMVIDMNLTTKDVGFNDKNVAAFFNEYTVDDEPNKNELLDMVCPSEANRERGFEALDYLYRMLKEYGLRLVYENETGTLGLVNDIEVEGCDVEDDGAVLVNAVSLRTSDKPILYVSDCWTFKVKK